MVPIYVKGGSWSNAEDEVLRAAVSKYGLNQWSRVASLLSKKTAKQAKARWNEYLDPRIVKSDWSQNEDSKLLELARLIPNQWRTIASKLGRTATQCIQRYQKLLDDEGSSELSLSGPGVETLESVGASKELHLGDINVNAETKEARPDAVDMDDDEKEMLAEARARLANTKGKKATRKARERMLEESKRVALLQKRRDLKQAGITTKLKAPKKKYENQFDYNADIPFEHKPSGGFYSTTEEEHQNQHTLQKFERQVNISGVKDESEKKKSKRSRNDNTGGQILEKPNVVQDDLSKRRKLELPEPIFKETELVDLVKSGENVGSIALERISQSATNADEKINDLAREIKRSKVERSVLLTVGDTEEPDEVDNLKEENVLELSDPMKLEKSFNLRQKLASLPKPKNDFEILEEDENTEADTKNQEQLKPISERDLGEEERLRKIQETKELELALLRRSQAVQKGLPIPSIDGEINFDPIDGSSSLQLSVDREAVKLIRSDFSKQHKLSGVPLLGDLSKEAKDLVEKEIQKEINAEELKKFQETFIPKYKSFTEGKKIPTSELLLELTGLMESSNKLEKSVQNSLSVYLQENEELENSSVNLLRDLKEADRALSAFTMLYDSERIVIESRADDLRESVDKLVQAEQRGQERYLELRRSLNSN